MMRVAGLVGGAAAALTRRDLQLTPTSVRLMDIMAPMDHGKAVRELGWQPRDVHESIRAAAEFFLQRRRERVR